MFQPSINGVLVIKATDDFRTEGLLELQKSWTGKQQKWNEVFRKKFI